VSTCDIAEPGPDENETPGVARRHTITINNYQQRTQFRMSAYKRVVDYMKNAPDSANHIAAWETAYLSKLVSKVDGLEEEKRLLGPVERDILASFDSQVKFTRHDLASGVTIGLSVDGRTRKGDQIIRSNTHKIVFKEGDYWELLPSVAQADYVTRDPAFYTLDSSLKDKIVRQCSSLSPEQLQQIRMDGVKDALSMPVDMRHIYMKMVLLLNDYNLGSVSKYEECEMAEDLIDFRHPNLPDDARVAIVADHRIVIDAQGMSPMELGLLYFAAQQYPPIKYAGDNIYTNCAMEADDLAIVSPGPVNVDLSGMWRSPDNLYRIMWSIAAKTNSARCLLDAIRVMRGKCKHMADVTKHLGPQSVHSGVPLSLCKNRSMGEIDSTTLITSEAGYMSTSIALISDYLVGAVYQHAATAVVEELGLLGNYICSGGNVRADRVINGLLRDVGARHEDASVNILLKNWCSLAGYPITWGYGGMLKDYLIELTVAMRTTGWDVDMPQLNTLMPYLATQNNCWGLYRGYSGPPDKFADKDVKESSASIAVSAWLMGLRPSRPRVARNRSSKEIRGMSVQERELAAVVGDAFVVGTVRMWISDTLGGREDEMEESAGVLIKTAFKNVKCQLLYDRAEERWYIPETERDYAELVQRTTMGRKPEKDIMPIVTGPQPEGIKDPFNGVKAMVSQRPIKPSKGVRAAVSIRGDTYVPEYSLGGELTSELQPTRGSVLTSGTLKLKRIDMPESASGLDAIVKDLVVHGYLDDIEGRGAVNRVKKDAEAPKFDNIEELAGAAEKMGLGLDVVVDKVTAVSYGKGKHRILLGREGGKIYPLVAHDDGDTYDISTVEPQMDTDHIKRLGEYERLFARP
jgi:hypothetical protein